MTKLDFPVPRCGAGPATISNLLIDMLSDDGESELRLRVDKASDQLVVTMSRRLDQVDTSGQIQLCAHQAARAKEDATLRHALWLLRVLN